MTSPANCGQCGYQIGLWLDKDERVLRPSVPVCTTGRELYLSCPRCMTSLWGGDIKGRTHNDAGQRAT